MAEIATPPVAPAAPTPPPATPAAAPETPSASEAFESQFDLGEPTATSAPAAPAAPTQPAAAPTPPKKTGAQPAPPAKPIATPPPVEHEEVDGIKVPKFKSDKDFRGWGLGGYKKAKQLETDLTALQTRYQELEQKVPKTEQERQQLATKLADLEKKYTEASSELQFANYERSPEYKDKYEKPYQDAITRAHRDVSELSVTEEDRSQQPDENGKYPTKERPAKAEDFDQIYSMPLGAATKLAAKKFGPEAVSIVMNHRATIRQAAEAAVNALNTWKENSTKRQKDMETQTIQTRERVSSLWTTVNADIKAKNKDLFDEHPDDKEWNEALAKGTQMADSYFSDRSNQTVEQRVVFDAHIRNRIAAFPALVSENRRVKAQLEQANKDLAALRGSAPGAPTSASPTPPVEQSEGAMAEFDKKL